VLGSDPLGLWETRRGALLTLGRAEAWGEGFGGGQSGTKDGPDEGLRGGMIRDNTALSSTRWHKTSNTLRAMDHTVSHVTSGGGAAYRLAVAGRIACKDARLCDAFSCPWTSPATSDTLREIARGVWQRDNAPIRAGRVVLTLQCAQPDPVPSPPCAESTGPRSQPCQGILRGHTYEHLPASPAGTRAGDTRPAPLSPLPFDHHRCGPVWALLSRMF
jgi:hypothetical protein